jgi:SHS2 domain-containing protein
MAQIDGDRGDSLKRRGPTGQGERRHALLPHTADVGFVAHAPDLRGLFEEAARALADLASDAKPGNDPTFWTDVDVEAGDLVGLAYGWLNELIAIGDLEHAVAVRAEVAAAEQSHAGVQSPAWRIDARIGLRRYADGGLQARLQPKSATFHGLSVEQENDGWTLTAYLDV